MTAYFVTNNGLPYAAKDATVLEPAQFLQLTIYDPSAGNATYYVDVEALHDVEPSVALAVAAMPNVALYTTTPLREATIPEALLEAGGAPVVEIAELPSVASRVAEQLSVSASKATARGSLMDKLFYTRTVKFFLIVFAVGFAVAFALALAASSVPFPDPLIPNILGLVLSFVLFAVTAYAVIGLLLLALNKLRGAGE